MLHLAEILANTSQTLLTSVANTAYCRMDASVLMGQFLQRDVGDSPSSTIDQAAIDDCGERLDTVATCGYEAPSDAQVEKMPAPDEDE